MGLMRPFEQYVTPTDADAVEAITALVLDSVQSAHTRRAYGRAIRDFLAWYRETGQVGLSKAVVLRYAAHLRANGVGAASLNQRLSAIRKLAAEAADNGVLDAFSAAGIRNVKSVKAAGARMGFWLTKEQARRLLDAPDPTTISGARDLALLAVMLGCGLRRSEVAALTVEHVQERDGRWLVVNLAGKGNKVRSVVMPNWAKEAIDDWAHKAGIVEGPLFRQVNKAGRVLGPLSEVGVSWLIKQYGRLSGYDDLAAHDLRRTYAKLAQKGGADLEQLRLSLGHASLLTTQRYLGSALDLQSAPCDKLGL